MKIEEVENGQDKYSNIARLTLALAKALYVRKIVSEQTMTEIMDPVARLPLEKREFLSGEIIKILDNSSSEQDVLKKISGLERGN